nr:RNA methyltransferase [Deltaproteobacteria bacterium]
MNNNHIYIALIHHPVYDRKKEVVTTSITNLDIHDLARLAKTFGLGGFYIVQPSKLQVELADRIISHWERGAGATYNETRRVAFETIRMVPDVREMIRDVEDRTGVGARLVATTGKEWPGQVDFGQAKK